MAETALDKLERTLHAKLTKQFEDMDAKDIDGKPTWDAKSRVELFKIATEYMLKRRGTSGLGGNLGRND